MITDPFQRDCLPFAESLAGIDAQHICAGFYQRRHTLSIIARVDACADDIALILVQQFVGMLFVGIIVLAEDERLQPSFFIHDRQLIQLMLPDQIVGLRQRAAILSADQLVKRGHEIGHLCGRIHPGDTIIAAGQDTQQLSLRAAIFSNGHRGMAGLSFLGQHISQGRVSRQVRIAADKACLGRLDTTHHGCLIFHAL